jgi:hypothetical protein
MLGTRGLGKLLIEIISQNECGFSHFEDEQRQLQLNCEMREE